MEKTEKTMKKLVRRNAVKQQDWKANGNFHGHFLPSSSEANQRLTIKIYLGKR